MKEPAEALNLYCKQLREIKRRTFAIGEIFIGHFSTPFPATNAEFIYLQFRKILELIALSSLVANKDVYAKSEEKIKREWNAKEILRHLKTVNSDFYPQPSRQLRNDSTGVITLEPIASGFLTKDDFIELYDNSSELLHARNPFQPELDLDNYKSRTNEWAGRITTLLNHHSILLYGGNNMVAAGMQSKENGEPFAAYFTKMENPPIVPGTTGK